MCKEITTTIVQTIEICNDFYTCTQILKMAKSIQPLKCNKQVWLVPLNPKKKFK